MMHVYLLCNSMYDTETLIPQESYCYSSLSAAKRRCVKEVDHFLNEMLSPARVAAGWKMGSTDVASDDYVTEIAHGEIVHITHIWRQEKFGKRKTVVWWVDKIPLLGSPLEAIAEQAE